MNKPSRPRNPEPARQPTPDPATKAQIKSLRAAGKPAEWIAEHLRIPAEWVRAGP